MNQLPSPPLIHEFDLGSARGGKAGINREPLAIEVVRPLTEDDLPAIANPPPVAGAQPVVKSLRHSHHRLAQLVAEGKPGTEIALITGYSQSYISTIQGDPAFAELVSFYESNRQVIFADAQERLKVLGLDATEKLQEALHDPTATWSKKELMDLIEMTGINQSPGAGKGKPSPGDGTGVALTIQFVGAQPTTVEGSFTEVPSDAA